MYGNNCSTLDNSDVKEKTKHFFAGVGAYFLYFDIA